VSSCVNCCMPEWLRYLPNNHLDTSD
jgi:hypothetical protein